MAFLDKLRMYRKNLDLTQEELALKINVSQKTISSWEIGRTEPNMGEVQKLCKLFDCTIEDLTETRLRKLGEISIDDIYAKIPGLSLEALQDIQYHISCRIRELEEAAMLQHEKELLEKDIKDMTKRLEAYKEKIAKLGGV